MHLKGAAGHNSRANWRVLERKEVEQGDLTKLVEWGSSRRVEEQGYSKEAEGHRRSESSRSKSGEPKSPAGE